MKLIKLSDIDEGLELWRGTKIRLINDGEIMHPDDKYFDYSLTSLPWDSDNMILVNITENSHKEGAVYATMVPVDKSSNKVIVKKDGLKEALGTDFDHCFLMTSK